MDIIQELFSDTNVVSTSAVARAFELSETDAREWADELDVARIGASYAWAQADVEALSDQLDDDDGDGQGDSGDSSDDDDDPVDDDQSEDEDDE